MRSDNKTVSTIIGAVILLAGIYVAWKLIKALGFVLIVVGIVLLGSRLLRR